MKITPQIVILYCGETPCNDKKQQVLGVRNSINAWQCVFQMTKLIPFGVVCQSNTLWISIGLGYMLHESTMQWTGEKRAGFGCGACRWYSYTRKPLLESVLPRPKWEFLCPQSRIFLFSSRFPYFFLFDHQKALYILPKVLWLFATW